MLPPDDGLTLSVTYSGRYIESQDLENETSKRQGT